MPDVSIAGAEDNPMPAMPNLESALGNSLQTVRRKHLFSQISGTQAEARGPEKAQLPFATCLGDKTMM